jgi:cell division protein FtsL
MSMFRLATWGWLGVVGLAGFATYEVKYQVAQVDDELGKVNRTIDADRDQLRVLSAEWSYLTQPGRLDQLRQRHLTLVPVTRAQLGDLDQIPFRAGEAGGPAVAAAAPSPGPRASTPAPRPPVQLPGGPNLVSAKPGASR